MDPQIFCYLDFQWRNRNLSDLINLTRFSSDFIVVVFFVHLIEVNGHQNCLVINILYNIFFSYQYHPV